MAGPALRCGAALACAALAARAYPAPKGEVILRNGGFAEDPERPVHWVTRSTGDLGTFSLAPPEAQGQSGTLKVDVTRAHQQPWMLELRQKLSGGLQKGQTLFIGFEYRLTEGYAFHCYWQKDSPPWPKFLAIRVSEPTGRWETCMVTVPAPETLTADETSLSFHLAESTGTVEFRNATVVAVAADVDPAQIQTTIQPVFGGDFYDQDWRNKVLERLQSVRKADLTVEVTRNGEAVADAAVTVTQTGRPFSFGVEFPMPLVFGVAGLEEPSFLGLKRRLGEDAAALPAFLAKVTEPGLFDTVGFSDGLIWRDYEHWGRKRVPEALAWARQAGKRVHGQGLFIPTFRFAPPKARLMEREDLLNAVQNHIRQVTTDLKGQVTRWDVLHAVLQYGEIYEIVGVEVLLNSFRLARKQDPEALLLVHDAEALLLPSDKRLEEFIEFVSWLRSENIQVDGIVFGASLARPYTAPQTIESRLDRVFASGLRLPIYIASLELEADKDTLQAAMLQDLLTLFYSHPVVCGVGLSSPWEPAATNRRCALYAGNMRAKKAGSMVEDLLTKEWKTTAEGRTDAQGLFRVQGFHGSYRVTVAAGEAKGSGETELTPEGSTLRLALE